MKLTKNQKKFIKSNNETLSVKEISSKLNIKRKYIEKYLSDIGKPIKQKVKKTKSTLDPYIKLKSWKDVLNFWKRHLDFIGITTFVILIVYANSLKGGFVSDDIPGYLNNPITHDFGASLKTLNIHRMIHAINWAMFKTNPIGSHLSSVIFHMISTVFAFTMLANVFNKKTSMLATLLFALHPVNTESISWISGRGHVIMGAFTFLIFIFYEIFKNTNNKKYLWISFGTFIIFLISVRSPKVLAAVPLIMIFDQFFYEKKIKLKSLIKFWPLVLASGLFLILISSRVTGRINSVGSTSPTETTNPYFIRLSYSIFKTVELLIFPKNLSLYQEGEVITQLMSVRMYLNLAVLIIVTAWAWKKNRIIAGLILMIFASLFYMLSPYQVAWFIADRYLYIATLFFELIVVYYLTKLESKLKIKNLALITVVIISLVYSAKIIIRNKDWSNRKTLWEATARTNPNSPRVYNNLGDVYAQEQDFEKSIEAFNKAIQLKPGYPDPVHNLGMTYLKMEALEKAEQQFIKALEIKPDLYQSYMQLAVIEYERENYEQAVSYLNKALEINPQYQQAVEAKQTIQSLMDQ